MDSPCLRKMHKEIDECLKVKRKRLMRNREHRQRAFGQDIKQDFEYVPLQMTRRKRVKVELSLVCIDIT